MPNLYIYIRIGASTTDIIFFFLGGGNPSYFSSLSWGNHIPRAHSREGAGGRRSSKQLRPAVTGSSTIQREYIITYLPPVTRLTPVPRCFLDLPCLTSSLALSCPKTNFLNPVGAGHKLAMSMPVSMPTRVEFLVHIKGCKECNKGGLGGSVRDEFRKLFSSICIHTVGQSAMRRSKAMAGRNDSICRKTPTPNYQLR